MRWKIDKVIFTKKLKQYYILCETDKINGEKMYFKSHSFSQSYLKNEIEKKNFKQFTIKYNRQNLKQYIIDSDKIDRIMYK